MCALNVSYVCYYITAQLHLVCNCCTCCRQVKYTLVHRLCYLYNARCLLDDVFSQVLWTRRYRRSCVCQKFRLHVMVCAANDTFLLALHSITYDTESRCCVRNRIRMRRRCQSNIEIARADLLANRLCAELHTAFADTRSIILVVTACS